MQVFRARVVILRLRDGLGVFHDQPPRDLFLTTNIKERIRTLTNMRQNLSKWQIIKTTTMPTRTAVDFSLLALNSSLPRLPCITDGAAAGSPACVASDKTDFLLPMEP